MRTIVRATLAPLRSGRLWTIQLAGKTLLPLSGAMWLLIPEAQTWQLVAAVLAMLVWVFLFLWLESGTLLFAANPVRQNFAAAFRPRLRGMLWLLLGSAAFFWLYMVLIGWSESNLQLAGYLYSKAPAWLRPTGGSLVYSNTLGHILLDIAVFFMPGILLPVLAAKVLGTEPKRAIRALANWRYWLTLFIIAHLGLWLPAVILEWRFGNTARMQAISLALRLTLALICGTAAWIMTAGLLGCLLRGTDVERAGVAV